jgi:MFS family permease
MWELYAFWTFIPFIISHLMTNDLSGTQLSMMSFSIIAIGSLACIGGGYIAYSTGSFRVAFYALAASCLCCIFSPLIFTLNPVIVYVFMLFWGLVVIMDSPQFSTLIARHAPQDIKGSALTIINCIGFTITILSIQLLTMLSKYVPVEWLYVFLFPGPALGVWAMIRSQYRQVIIQKSIP